MKQRRVTDDRLLNEVDISTFIGHICGVHFRQSFVLAKRYHHCWRCIAALESPVAITSTARTEPVYPPYRNDVTHADSKIANLHSLRSGPIHRLEALLPAWLKFPN